MKKLFILVLHGRSVTRTAERTASTIGSRPIPSLERSMSRSTTRATTLRASGFQTDIYLVRGNGATFGLGTKVTTAPSNEHDCNGLYPTATVK
jgi:hypothetical protein